MHAARAVKPMVHSVRRGMVRVTWAFDSAFALIVMLVTFTTVNTGRAPRGLQEFLAVRLTVRNVALVIAFMLVWRSCFALCGLYRTGTRSTTSSVGVARIVAACTMGTIFLTLFTVASRSGAFGLNVVLYFWVASVAVELIGRAAIVGFATYIGRRHRDAKRAVIVGSGPRALRLYQNILRSESADCIVTGFVDSRDSSAVPEEIRSRLLGNLQELEVMLSRQPIDQVLIALPVKSCYQAIQHVIDTCERVGVEVKYFPDLFSVSLARHAFDEGDGLQGVRLQLVADDHRLLVKRAIDVVGAVCGLIALLPLLIVCALAVRLTSPGTVLFSQLRYGYNRRQFRMYKFRTMVQDAERLQESVESLNEAHGPVFKIRADPRLTPVGRIMRKLSLDELPQLFNVLAGEMSLVGPRPMSIRDVTRFSESWLMRRFSVKPGLTCLWQVNGRSNTDFDRWVELDLAYIDNWSLALDMRILLKTVPVVLMGSGAM
jgi:exopolysaccharide biosynthesis polyprenyl glycosylphosphotransferase